MPFNGAGVFNRLYSWVADRNAGIDISSTRTDQDTNDIATGLDNCLTRDGQGFAAANLPMANFRHTGVADGQARTDYASFGQVQDALANWIVAGGTGDALIANYPIQITALKDGQLCSVRSIGANATTTPTFSPNGLTPAVITKAGGSALAPGDISGALTEIFLRYNLANTRWELLNPSLVALTTAITNTFSTGDAKLTYKTVADSGWVLMNDSSLGNTGSGAFYAGPLTQALYTLLWNNVSSPSANAYCRVNGGLGASAAADWAGLKYLALPAVVGRALAISGAGAGLSYRTLGGFFGEENHTLVAAEIPTITSVNGSQAISVTSTNPKIAYGDLANWGNGTGIAFQGFLANGNEGVGTQNSTGNNSISVTSNNTSGAAHNNMQPTSFLNAMVKL